MHYREYCKALDTHDGSPLGANDFYKGLNQIAENRATVLTDIAQMPTKVLPASYEVAQRCLDILLSCLGLIIGTIPFLVIAIAIKIGSKGPVFYRQKRVGKDGKVFQMIKF